MERSELFDLMGELKLYGMKAAFDEIMATAVKRQHEPQRIVGDLLNAEINEKQARSQARLVFVITPAGIGRGKGLPQLSFRPVGKDIGTLLLKVPTAECQKQR
jgi:hypothetical protein